MRYFGPLPKEVASRSCCAVQASVGERLTPTCITLRDFSSMRKKANSQRKRRSVTGRRVTRPDVLGMRVEERPPRLSSWPRASVKKSSSVFKLSRKLLGMSQDVQIMDDSATAQIEEILAQPTIACASSLPVTNMCESMLNGHTLAQFVASLRRLLTLA